MRDCWGQRSKFTVLSNNVLLDVTEYVTSKPEETRRDTEYSQEIQRKTRGGRKGTRKMQDSKKLDHKE